MPTPKNFSSHDEYLAWYRDYRKNNKEKIAQIRKKSNAKRGKVWDERNKLARYAHGLVFKALQRGILHKKPCEVCQSEINIHAHHDNYFVPLEVIWLCGIHHRARHKFLKESGIGVDGLY